MNKKFWKNKKVLITGHTGFKGSWLTLILSELGAKIFGYALNPISKPNFFDDLNLSKYLEKDFRQNILNEKKLNDVMSQVKPNIVFHMAAQSSVLVSYQKPMKTIYENVIGTLNVLEAIKKCSSVKSAIIVTTDKVYLNLESKNKFKESDNLGGLDIYSGSKAASEVLTNSFFNSFMKNKNLNLATVRSGNCIGGGDWTKDRIIKDCAESFIFNKNINIRSPKASRPWQHVIEPLFGYLKLSEKLFSRKQFSGSWNFGPNTQNNINVLSVAKLGKKILNSKSKIILTKKNFHEAEHLSLDSSKALNRLNWKTRLKSKDAIKMAFDWYSFFYKNRRKDKLKIINYTINQIKEYKRKFEKFL